MPDCDFSGYWNQSSSSIFWIPIHPLHHYRNSQSLYSSSDFEAACLLNGSQCQVSPPTECTFLNLDLGQA